MSSIAIATPTLGEVTYNADKGAWIVRCEPHVALRLRRVFGGLGHKADTQYAISDTIDNARDLEWFMERYPLQCSNPQRLRERAEKHRERASLVDKLLSNVAPANTFALAIPPREYQRKAATLCIATGGLLLADDVGLGKTCSAICTFVEPGNLPVIVVTLTHLTRQWRDEIQKFAPDLLVHIIKKGQPYDLTEGRRARNGQLSFDNRFPDVVVLNYHKLSGWAETLSRVAKAVIYDEIQELRRPESHKYSAARILSRAVEMRMGLSATPIYNYGSEMFSVMNCVSPGCLGTREEFNQEWCGGGSEIITSPKAFSATLQERGLMLRRTRADVGRELPPVTKIPHHVESDPESLKRLSAGCAELARIILAAGEVNRGDKMRASEELSNALRQATGIAKATYVAEFVKLLLESEKKVVLFGWHREVYRIWAEALAEFKPVFYTGTESPNQKEESKQAFTSGDSRVLIISLRAGAGLDGLQFVCRTVVVGELDWSPGVHEQNIGRIARDGQPDPVAAYFLVADEGSDPVVSQVLGLKTQQSEGIRNPNAELVEELQVDEGRIRRLAVAYLAQRGER